MARKCSNTLVKEQRRFTHHSRRMVYDFDTILPFPCPLDQYIAEAFHPELQLLDRFER